MARQEALKLAFAQAKKASLNDVVAGVLRKYGPKHTALAARLNASESHLSEVTKGHKHWPAEWLELIARDYDLEDEIAGFFAQLRGKRVTGPRRRTAAEELRRLRHTLAAHGALGTALQAEADALPDESFGDSEE